MSIYSALDVAIYETVHSFEGGPKRLAKQLGMPLSSLLNKANPAQDDRHFSPDELLAIMGATANFSILFVLADETGHRCRPIVGQPDDHDLFGHLTLITSEHGELAKALVDASADGSYSRNERKRLVKEALDVINELHRFVKKVQNVREEGAER